MRKLFILFSIILIASPGFSGTKEEISTTESHYVGLMTARTRLRFDVVRLFSQTKKTPSVRLQITMEKMSPGGGMAFLVLDPDELSALMAAIPRIVEAAKTRAEKQAQNISTEISYSGRGFDFGAMVSTEDAVNKTFFLRVTGASPFLAVIEMNWFEDFERLLSRSSEKIQELKR